VVVISGVVRGKVVGVSDGICVENVVFEKTWRLTCLGK